MGKIVLLALVHFKTKKTKKKTWLTLNTKPNTIKHIQKDNRCSTDRSLACINRKLGVVENLLCFVEYIRSCCSYRSSQIHKLHRG